MFIYILENLSFENLEIFYKKIDKWKDLLEKNSQI